MATEYGTIRESLRALLGNRTDIDAMIEIAINDALKATAGTHPDPTHLRIVQLNLTTEETQLLDEEETPQPLLETVTAASIYTGGDYTANPRPDGLWQPLDKGNPEIFLYPPEVNLPTKWIVVGGEAIAPYLRVSPPPDAEYTVRLLGYKTFPYITDGPVYVPDVLIPAVRLLAVGICKVMLGQVEDGGTIVSWARSLAKGIDSQVRTEQHGHSGLKPYLE